MATPSAPLLAVWAKSGPTPHPLLAHALDTGAVAAEILRREPEATRKAYAEDLGLPEPAAIAWAAGLCGLHDFGKATPVFQAAWEPGAAQVQRAGLPLPRGVPRQGDALWVSHGVLTEALGRDAFRALGLSPRTAAEVSRAVGAHHGFPARSEELARCEFPDVRGDATWDRIRLEFLTVVRQALQLTGSPAVARLPGPAALRLMALASVADWIASDTALFPYGRDASEPLRYFGEARELARRALDALGWHHRRPLAEHSVRFSDVFPFPPNSVQRAVSEALDALEEPGLLLVEAPTGSGKTEAALFAHLALSARFGHRGLYVALPTQATGNGLLPRVRRFLERQGDRPLDLQLQHGAAWLHPLYRELQPRGVGGPDDEGADQEPRVLARSWFSPRKRAMLSEYGVGTVDQALLGALRVRHHFIRLWGLGNRTVVLDEVHAYDVYTSGLIEVLLRWLRALGSSVVLLSATLPAAKRRAFLEAFGAPAPPAAPTYPRLVIAQGNTSRAETVPWSREQCYQVEPAPRPVDELARFLLRRLSGPGSAACIVNTVDRAQRLYQAFGPGRILRLGEIWPTGAGPSAPSEHADLPVGKVVGEAAVLLFHARYPGEERQAREDLILALFGPAGRRPHRSVLVATQVLEQSLDLDFDLMVTDLAPIDLIIQRAGRLHRHKRPRPAALGRARLLIAGLDEDPPDLDSDAWARVYEPYPLLASWWVLRGRAHVRIPSDLDSLLEAVYGEVPLRALLDRLGEQAEAAWAAWQERLGKQQDLARAVALNDPDRLLSLSATGAGYAVDQLELDDDEESPETQALLTRLGEPSITVVPLHRTPTGLALDPEGRQPARLAGVVAAEEARRLYARAVRLGRPEVFRALSGVAVPTGWREHPVLRRLRPLELVDGRADIGGIEIRLDPALGVVYARHPVGRMEGE